MGPTRIFHRDLDTFQNGGATLARLQQQRLDQMIAYARSRSPFYRRLYQRLPAIRDADLILVMRDGDIVEQGDHKSLLQAGGFYAELYNSQFEPEAVAAA